VGSKPKLVKIMKKLAILLFAAAVASTGSALAQGTVVFNNASSSLVRVNDPVAGTAVPIGATSGYGGLLVGLFWGAQGAAEGSLVQIGATTSINPIAGRYSGGQRVTGAGTAAGATGTFQIRAWSADLGADWAAASTSGATGWIGKSALFDSATGGAGSPASPAVPLANTVPGFAVTLVPEPSVVALAVLGAGALLFRRRKA
jgi:hypothetical protein